MPAPRRAGATKGDPCSCPRHDGKCSNITTERGYFMCSPCGAGNHTVNACANFKPFEDYYHRATCRDCGYGRDAHGST